MPLDRVGAGGTPWQCFPNTVGMRRSQCLPVHPPTLTPRSLQHRLGGRLSCRGRTPSCALQVEALSLGRRPQPGRRRLLGTECLAEEHRQSIKSRASLWMTLSLDYVFRHVGCEACFVNYEFRSDGPHPQYGSADFAATPVERVLVSTINLLLRPLGWQD